MITEIDMFDFMEEIKNAFGKDLDKYEGMGWDETGFHIWLRDPYIFSALSGRAGSPTRWNWELLLEVYGGSVELVKKEVIEAIKYGVKRSEIK